MNTTLHNHLINTYNTKAFTHHYIYGFRFLGNVYIAYATAEDMPYLTKLDKASRGAGYSLRFKPTKAQKTFLLQSAKVLCSEKYFNECYENSIYNRGEIFEKLVTEMYGQTWVKDNVPFTMDGDLTVDGIAYQIKYEGATFCTEKSLANL